MFLYILIILVVAVVAFLAYASTKPNTFRVERTLSIKAPAEKIFPLINDFHQWVKWSPFEKMDLNMKKMHSGAEKGVGSVYSWEGNNKVGVGRMEILESNSPSKVKLSLDFLKPMKGNSFGEFLLKQKGEETEVTWAMLGKQPFMGKVMCVFINMDKLVGKDFAAGLANLKAEVEK